MNKEMRKLKDKILKAQELIFNENGKLKCDFDLLRLTKLKYEIVPAEEVKFESKVQNLGRLRGIRKPPIIKTEITFEEFLSLETKELKYPILDIESKKEEIIKFLKTLDEKIEVKICEANIKIKDLYDQDYGKESKKEREELEILLAEIADEATEIDCNEYDNETTDEIEELIQQIIRYLSK